MKRLASTSPGSSGAAKIAPWRPMAASWARALAIAMSIAVFHGVGVENFSAVMEPFREASV